MRPGPLPPDLPPAFTVAQARALGVSAGRLRSSDLAIPFAGTRTQGVVGDAARVRVLLQVLPAYACASGVTAAILWGLPLPRRWEQRARDIVEVAVPAARTRVRRAGVTCRRLQLVPGDVVAGSGIRLLSPARLWVDLADRLPLPGLVALTDHLIARRQPLVERDALALLHARFAGGRGAAARAAALDLCDDGAESPRESIVRVLLVRAGLPRPECNVNIFDGTRFVGRVDMLYREQRLIVEYDGDYHRDPLQWSRDQSRRAELESLDYRVTVVTRADLDDPVALVARIRRLMGS